MYYQLRLIRRYRMGSLPIPGVDERRPCAAVLYQHFRGVYPGYDFAGGLLAHPDGASGRNVCAEEAGRAAPKVDGIHQIVGC